MNDTEESINSLQINTEQNHKKRSRSLLKRIERVRRVRNFRIILITIFIATTTLIAFLGWKKVGSTEVAIHLTVNQVCFVTDEKWNIYSVETEILGLSHLDDLELFPLTVEEAVSYDPDTYQPVKWQRVDVPSVMRIKRTEDYWNASIKSSYLNLSKLEIDSGATVTVAVTEQKYNQLKVTINSETTSGTVETGDTLILTCNNCKTKKHTNEDNSFFNTFRIMTRDREIKFSNLNKSIDLILEFPKGELRSNPYIFGKSINIQKVDFTRFEDNERASTIVKDGKIYFAELDGKEFDIREGDFIIMDGLKNFQIKRLILDGQIGLFLHGRVKKLKSGTQVFLYSRLPSYLEWLRTNQSIAIFLATLIPVFSTILAVFYRLRIIKEI